MSADPTMAWSSPAMRALVLDKPKHAVWNAAQFAAVMTLAGASPGVRIVDIGAGSGAMLPLFADLLAAHPGAHLTCVDREPALADTCATRAADLGLADRVSALAGDAAHLPLPDASVDLAFCQTVLMHVADPTAVLTELRRVVRPGGHIVLVEGNALVRPSLLARVAPEIACDVLRLWQFIRRGRRALGRGDIAIGEELPRLCAAAALDLVAARLVDRILIDAPTAPADDRATHRDLLTRAQTVMGLWRPGFAEAFLAAGGTASDFDRLWQTWRTAEDTDLAAAHAGTFAGTLTGVLYAFIARRP